MDLGCSDVPALKHAVRPPRVLTRAFKQKHCKPGKPAFNFARTMHGEVAGMAADMIRQSVTSDEIKKKK